MINPGMKRTANTALLAVLFTSLAGCVSVLPEPAAAPTIYRLTVPVAGQDMPLEQTNVVNIEYPLASSMLGGTDIVLSPDTRSLTAAANARWAEPVPSLLRNALIDGLTMRGNVTGVVPKGSTRVPYRLNTDIRRFEAVFDRGENAGPLAVVQLKLAVTEAKTRKLIGTRTIYAEQRAGAATVSSIVGAQEGATQQAVDEIVQWLNTSLNTPAQAF